MTHEPMTCDTFTELLGAMFEGDLDPSQVAAVEAHAAGCAGCAALRADLERISMEASRLPVLTPSRDLWQGIAERIEPKVLPLAAPVTAVSPRRRWAQQSLMAAALVLVTASVTWFVTRQAHERSTSGQMVATDRARQIDSAMSPAETSRGVPQVASDNRDGPRPVVSSPVSETAASSQVQVALSDPRLTGGQAGPAGERSSGGTRPTTRPDPTGERRPAAARGEQLASSGSGRNAASAPAETSEEARAVEAVYGAEIQRLYDVITQRKADLDPATVKVIEDNLAIIDSAIVQSRRAIARDPGSGFLMEQLNSVLDRKVELLRTAAMLPARS